jgi:hypothetical protein
MRRILLLVTAALIVAAMAVATAAPAFAVPPAEVCIKQLEAGRNVPTSCPPFAG